jgi:ribonuclease BN (tRNA processing enzyme)
MQLVLLGSGTAIPAVDRSSPALALFTDGRPVLFDFGPGTLRQLVRAGIPHHAIHHIFVTHFHPDHTAGLIHLLFATRNPAILSKRHPFSIAGPPGLSSLLNDLKSAYAPVLDLPPDILKIMELDPREQEPVAYPHFQLFLAHTNHSPESLAYRVQDHQGRSMVYSGDTGFSEEVIRLARGTDLLVLECSFPDNLEMVGHLTPSSAGRMASLAGAKRLLLTHFYPECLGTDIAAQCRKTYKGELILARDLLSISF